MTAKKSEDVTFYPAVSFTGFPDGKTPVKFTAGVESAPVSAEYLELLRTKELVLRKASS